MTTMRRLAILWAGALTFLAGCGGGPATVVVYTPLGKAALEPLQEALREAHPALAVRFETVADAEALARLRDGATPRAHVWLGAPSWWLARGAAEGLLVEGAPTWADAVPPAMRDPAGLWTGILADPVVLAFGSDGLSRSRAPRDWVDLLHPRWSGELWVAEPGATDGGTALLAWHMWDARARWGDAHQGLDWFARLDAWRRGYASDEAEAVRRLRAGEGTLALVTLSAAEAGRSRGGVDYRVTESETPTVVLGVARVARRTGDDPASPAADAFLEWLGSPEARGALATGTNRLPLAGMPPTGPGWAESVIPALRPVAAPADSVAPLLEGWITTWRSQVRGRATTLFLP